MKNVKKTSIPSQHVQRVMHSRQIQYAVEPRLCFTSTEDRAKTFVPIETTLCYTGFEILLLAAVDEVLSSLGDTSEQMVYSHLEKAFNIRRLDIPHKIDEFASAIERSFGVGAKLLEIQIMKLIHEKIGPSFKCFPKRNDLIFTEYVNAARVKFDERSTNAEAKLDILPSDTLTFSWKQQILKLA